MVVYCVTDDVMVGYCVTDDEMDASDGGVLCC